MTDKLKHYRNAKTLLDGAIVLYNEARARSKNPMWVTGTTVG